MHKLKQKQPTAHTRAGWAIALLAVLSLLGCKPKVEDLRTCAERLQVTTRNGVKVVKTASGLYLKLNGASWGCGTTPATEHLVEGGDAGLVWNHGEFMPAVPKPFTQEQWDKLDGPVRAVLLQPWREGGANVHLYFRFDGEPPKSLEQRKKDFGAKDWWYAPKVPHKSYPLDLLPNYRLENEATDPEKAIIKYETYWEVRGSAMPSTKMPYVTICSMSAPTTWKEADGNSWKNPEWLTQAPASGYNLFSCRGGVGEANGLFGAILDIPQKAVPEIDKIYKAASQYLSNLVVE